MKRSYSDRLRRRRGAVVILVALLLIPFCGVLAFAIDYGFLLLVRTNLQRAADAACLAAAQDLPEPNYRGWPDRQYARLRVDEYVNLNLDPQDESFAVLDTDVEMGNYDPNTIYSGTITIGPGGELPIYDTVRVTVRRDSLANSPVGLFFAQVLGIHEMSITASATAVLRKGTALQPKADLLPFAVPVTTWSRIRRGSDFTLYGSGRVEDIRGRDVPGNWGTVDIGAENNSTRDISDQIREGLRQSDLDALHADGRISDASQLVPPFSAQGDTGLSAGMEAALETTVETSRIIPIYDTVSGPGNNAEFHIVGFGVVFVREVDLHGRNPRLVVSRSFIYDDGLVPQPDLSVTTGVIENAFTSPVLVE